MRAGRLEAMETTLPTELVDVILRDGTTLRLRTPTSRDADALVAFYAGLAEDNPEVAELDLNPVLGLVDGCLAVDARVRLERAPARTNLKSW